MKLKVLAGAKEGTEIPLKRSKFLIGRSRECTLTAGSEAISRRHCVVLTTEEGVTVRDLGSRNGTLVNGEKIEKETRVDIGDTLQVGPLFFEFISTSADIRSDKKPKVKSVAEAVDRAASSSSEEVADDDISSWLLGAPASPSAVGRETMSFRVDETRHSGVRKHTPEEAEQGSDEQQSAEESNDADAAAEPGVDDQDKKKKKKAPGKLPQVPKKPQAKDSREAAANILREMARRR